MGDTGTQSGAQGAQAGVQNAQGAQAGAQGAQAGAQSGQTEVTLASLLETMSAEDILAAPELRKAVQAATDARVTQALNTAKAKWQQEQLDSIDEAKKLEKMTAEQRAQYQFKKDKAAFEAEKKKFEHEQLVMATGKELLKRGLDASFAESLTGATAEETADKINSFETSFKAAVSAQVGNRMKGGAPKDKGGNTSYTMDDLRKMTPAEINAHWSDVQNALKNAK